MWFEDFLVARGDGTVRKPRHPALVRNNIAKTIEVSVILTCQPVPIVAASR